MTTTTQVGADTHIVIGNNLTIVLKNVDKDDLIADDFQNFAPNQVGTDGDDILSTGGDQNITINAGDGDDIITGGHFDSTMHGDGGNDTITGGLARDTIFSGDGADSIDGNWGRDTIDGGAESTATQKATP
ncbi:MAG: calcium-binding protein [Alphaproteobacteria bacterium]|jgi:Ca2+-binding RTX toxin-like protein